RRCGMPSWGRNVTPDVTPPRRGGGSPMTLLPQVTGLGGGSIEGTNRCAQACWFCYNNSAPEGATSWAADERVGCVDDCAAHGGKAVSSGGGAPLQYGPLFEVFARLRGVLFRSMTTNGLLLDGLLDRVVEAAPDKVHLSIHFPERKGEVQRVIRQVGE